MHSPQERWPGDKGSALVFSVAAVMAVSILTAVFLRLAGAVSRELSSPSDTLQALNIAEAGLAEAYMGLAVAHTGKVGSAESPAVFGGGLFWVEAREHPNGLVELESTALYGTGRATLGIVCEPVGQSVASLGFFSRESLGLSPGVRLDSYDSRQGSHASQLGTRFNERGILGTNGDLSIASGGRVFGDVLHGPMGKLDVAEGASLTGRALARPIPEVLPAIEVPPIPLARRVQHKSGIPLIVPPGEAGFESIEVGQNTMLVLDGPLTIVVGSLALEPGAELKFDTTDGQVQLFVTESLDFDSGSLVSTTGEVTTDSLLFVAAPQERTVHFGAKSQFHGFIYAPDSEVRVSAQYEIHGALVCRSLRLEAQGKLHYDLRLGATLESQLPLLRGWRVVELPESDPARRTDPFQVLELERASLRPPWQAHEDQTLEVRYVGPSGRIDSFLGPERDFDWSLVERLLSGLRGGVAFFSPGEAARGKVAADPPVDLVHSSPGSREASR